jgi:hypothetical protein
MSSMRQEVTAGAAWIGVWLWAGMAMMAASASE